MKLGIIGCLTGAAAATLFTGCASDPSYATADSPRDTYRGAFRTAQTADPDERFAVEASDPVFVEQRMMVVDNRSVQVPVYRTGDEYFYTYGGRRFTMTDDTTVRRTSRPRALSSGAYRDALRSERPLVRTGYTED